jgi:hypothetical protein
MHGAIPPLPQYAFMAWCLVKYMDNFTFTFFMVMFRHQYPGLLIKPLKVWQIPNIPEQQQQIKIELTKKLRTD